MVVITGGKPITVTTAAPGGQTLNLGLIHHTDRDAARQPALGGGERDRLDRRFVLGDRRGPPRQREGLGCRVPGTGDRVS